eukprot:8652997-Alexandrium_andersonii.AAC.1
MCARTPLHSTARRVFAKKRASRRKRGGAISQPAMELHSARSGSPPRVPLGKRHPPRATRSL